MCNNLPVPFGPDNACCMALILVTIVLSRPRRFISQIVIVGKKIFPLECVFPPVKMYLFSFCFDCLQFHQKNIFYASDGKKKLVSRFGLKSLPDSHDSGFVTLTQ